MVILGITALFFPLEVKTNTTWIEIPFTILAALVVLVIAGDRMFAPSAVNRISREEGMICLFFFMIFMAYIAFTIKGGSYTGGIPKKVFSLARSVIMIIAGLLMLGR